MTGVWWRDNTRNNDAYYTLNIIFILNGEGQAELALGGGSDERTFGVGMALVWMGYSIRMRGWRKRTPSQQIGVFDAAQLLLHLCVIVRNEAYAVSQIQVPLPLTEPYLWNAEPAL